ncbi:MAG TPA: adenylate/guanylate cyclase domain-containing protein [Geminicoccaceae bacterium]
MLATLALCLGYLPVSRAPAVQQIEAQLLDLRFRLRPQAPPSDHIVLVLIDEASIREVGRWPWSRAVIAEGLARLSGAGARTIGIDLLFAEAEPSAVPEAWRDRMRQALGELGSFLDRLSGDAELAREMRAAANVVLPFSFGLGGPVDADLPEPPDAVATTAFRIVHRPGSAASMPPLSPTSVLAPIPELAQAASTLGHTNGTARYEFPAVAYGDNIYPSFALELARQHLSVPRDHVRLELGRGVWLGDRLVPTDHRTQLVVNYRGTNRFQSVSFAQLLAGSIPAADFEGKVVLIGASAAGLGETFVTPFDAYLPGIEWRATVIDNILRRDFLVRRNDGMLLELGVVIFGGLLIGSLAGRAGLLGTSLGFAALVAGVLAINLVAFFELGRWFNLFAPLLALLALYAIAVLYKYFIGERQERRIRAAFKHYLSPALVEQVARDPALLRLGGEQKELTVLFADIRDSTRLGAKLPPPVFVELLNEVLDTMTAVLFAHDGMLDKYTGDGLVAVFGAPLPQPEHAVRACRAALAMLDELRPVRARWARPDLPPLEVGIGINTGPMIIGNMGSKERFAYTVIGDEANLGARLEAANKDFQTHILISEATWQQVKDEIAARELDVVTFRGMARPVRVYEVLGTYPLAERETQRLAAFESGLAAWRDQRWPEAKGWFEQALALAPEDRPSQIYLERCRARLAGGREASIAS